MLDQRRIKYSIVVVLAVMIWLHINIAYFCDDNRRLLLPDTGHVSGDGRWPPVVPVTGWKQRHLEDVVSGSESGPTCQHDDDREAYPEHTRGSVLLPNFTTVPLDSDYQFDPEGHRDVIVFLHIQKTGGTTFGRHLVSNLDLKTRCKCRRDRKRCDCRNGSKKIWIVNRYSTGWRCGLHADWTELTQCVDSMLDRVEGSHRERRFLFITLLRHPYTRYLSEFKHVQRGATWKAARLQCDGRQASLEEVPFCFQGQNWTGVTLAEFMECPHNLANNRQVRMLANLSLSGCYKNDAMSPDVRHCTMLKSAKDNLRQMAFFGLTEFQRQTQRLFERTFGLRFRQDFYQYNHTHAAEVNITPSEQKEIIRRNRLDVELYQYARELFFERLRAALRQDAGQRTSQPSRYSAEDSNHSTDADSYLRGEDEDDADDDNDGNDMEADDSEYNKRIVEQTRTTHDARHFQGGWFV